MATPPNKAKELAVSLETPLGSSVGSLVGSLVVEVALSSTTTLLVVTVVGGGVEVVKEVLLWTVEETKVDEGMVTLELVTVVLLVWDLVVELVASASDVVEVTVLVASLVVEVALVLVTVTEVLVLISSSSSSSSSPSSLSLSSPLTILKGKPYWKMLGSDSRVIMMP